MGLAWPAWRVFAYLVLCVLRQNTASPGHCVLLLWLLPSPPPSTGLSGTVHPGLGSADGFTEARSGQAAAPCSQSWRQGGVGATVGPFLHRQVPAQAEECPTVRGGELLSTEPIGLGLGLGLGQRAKAFAPRQSVG